MGRGLCSSFALALCVIVVSGSACSDPVLYVGVGVDPTSTPATWQEHWFEHDQLLTLSQSDDAVALYYDKDVDASQATTIFPYVSQIAHYTTATYGPLGPGRLYVVIHKDRYLGCHEADHYNPSHDHRNTIDCGLMAYDDQTIFGTFIPHFMAVLVEHVVAGHQGAPADVLWNHEGKWAEFYRYDLYVGIGRKDEADSWYGLWTSDTWTDPFPAPKTHWFRDWFYPLWRDRGGAAVMSRFFALLARDFPSQNGQYTRDMNWGEFVHFMSGAAGTDEKPLATFAFGWSIEWEDQLEAARAAFPGIKY